MTSFLQWSFYQFTPVADPRAWQAPFRQRLCELGVLGSIILSPEGINGMLSIPTFPKSTPEKLREFLLGYFPGLEPKESVTDKHVYKYLLIKIKPALIPGPVNWSQYPGGKRLDPVELKKWYESGKDFFILDTRNQYEFEHGAFENSHTMKLKRFRDFPNRLKEAIKTGEIPSDKPVVMFCTGGIRCEKATAIAHELGLKDVYQLEGGILKYFEKCGQAHYQGECFVFDERTQVNAELKPA